MEKNKLSPNTKALIKKMHIFNLVWGILSVSVLFLLYLLGINNLGIIAGGIFSFLFGGEAVFHYRLLGKVQEMCNDRYPYEPWKARQEYKSHLIMLWICAGIGFVGVLGVIISLIGLWLN